MVKEECQRLAIAAGCDQPDDVCLAADPASGGQWARLCSLWRRICGDGVAAVAGDERGKTVGLGLAQRRGGADGHDDYRFLLARG